MSRYFMVKDGHGVRFFPAEDNMKYETREEWLTAAVDAMRPLFAAIDEMLPPVRVSVGFPSRGGLSARNRVLGQCWDKKTAADSVAQIFVTPLTSDAGEVLAILAHECVHAIVGAKGKHGPLFRKPAVRLGLVGKMTATKAGPDLTANLSKIAVRLGQYPHAALKSPTVTAHPKQKARLRLFVCECGIKVRVARDDFDATCGLCSEPFKRSDT